MRPETPQALLSECCPQTLLLSRSRASVRTAAVGPAPYQHVVDRRRLKALVQDELDDVHHHLDKGDCGDKVGLRRTPQFPVQRRRVCASLPGSMSAHRHVFVPRAPMEAAYRVVAVLCGQDLASDFGIVQRVFASVGRGCALHLNVASVVHARLSPRIASSPVGAAIIKGSPVHGSGGHGVGARRRRRRRRRTVCL